MRVLDPFGIYLGNGRETLGKGEKGDFATFIRVMEDSFSNLEKLASRGTAVASDNAGKAAQAG
jgi:hypothetical protein